MSNSWPFTGTETSVEEVSPEAQKIQEQEEIIQKLRFTPRTYTVTMYGYGGEIVLGSVSREHYEYFRDNDIDIEEYAWDSDNEQEVPEDMQPFDPGCWHECDNVAHESGVELSEYNTIMVSDENGNEVWSCKLGYTELTDAGVEVECFDESLCSDRTDRENTVGFIGQSGEKGTFFEGPLELTAPFDPSKFVITYSDIEGWALVSGVDYEGESIEGMDGYSTTGKSSDFKFYDIPDEE